jgi:hypothetical protein
MIGDPGRTAGRGRGRTPRRRSGADVWGLRRRGRRRVIKLDGRLVSREEGGDEENGRAVAGVAGSVVNALLFEQIISRVEDDFDAWDEWLGRAGGTGGGGPCDRDPAMLQRVTEGPRLDIDHPRAGVGAPV